MLTGRGNARLRVTVDPNNPNNYWPERNGDITIHSGRHVAYINVVQKEMFPRAYLLSVREIRSCLT